MDKNQNTEINVVDVDNNYDLNQSAAKNDESADNKLLEIDNQVSAYRQQKQGSV